MNYSQDMVSNWEYIKNGSFNEQLFPFDAIPRVIERKEFDYLEKGLKQRVMALNMFLKDIYGDKKIVKDKVVPEDFIFESSGYLAECEGVFQIKDIYAHISGIDLVQGKNKEWYILEDNLRVPSGASYPMIARELCRKSSPLTFNKHILEDNRNYAKLLRKAMDNVNVEGHTVILTPGRYNAPTYLPFYEEDMKYVLDNFDNLVLKDVAEAGGYGVQFGSSMTKKEKENFIKILKEEPRRFIAQEVIDFLDINIMDGNDMVPRKADLRAFVLMGEEPMVWKSGLTRFSRNPNSFIVNSSQGGGFKDTWVLSH